LTQVFSGLRFRLLLLVLLVCAPLVVLIWHSADEDRHRAMTGWEQRSAEILQIAHSEEEEMVDAARQFLLAISESSAVHSLRAHRCSEFLRDQLRYYPRYASLGVLKTNGELVATVFRDQGSNAPPAKGFFERTLVTRALATGDFPERSATGKPTITFGYPVLDRTGRVLAVAYAEMDRPWFTRLGYDFTIPFPKGATWTEIDESGRMLTRYPSDSEWYGEPMPENALLPLVAGRGKGAIELADHKGVPFFYAFNSRRSSLTQGAVVSILGIPRQVLFAEADRLLRRNLSLLGLAACSAFVLGWIGSKILVLRPVQALVRSTTRLAAGDLTVRTGVAPTRDELGQLTRAFDHMVQTLEQREAERQRASQKLQLLSHRLVEVQESERRHIARELHDEIGQSLTAAEMNLQAALQLPGNEALEKRLEESIQAVERVLEQVHDLSLSLRPSMLDDLGLEPALRSYTHRQAELIGMKAEFRGVQLESRLDSVIETECFRVAQEALTNVVRHAQAKAVTVQLTRSNGHLHLSVKDDGIGFDVTNLREEAVRGASLGLLSMEERASLAGGGIHFKSRPGNGTEVQAWFPLKWRGNSPTSEADEQ
jgi:signal transduction histidine kinase